MKKIARFKINIILNIILLILNKYMPKSNLKICNFLKKKSKSFNNFLISN